MGRRFYIPEMCLGPERTHRTRFRARLIDVGGEKRPGMDVVDAASFPSRLAAADWWVGMSGLGPKRGPGGGSQSPQEATPRFPRRVEQGGSETGHSGASVAVPCMRGCPETRSKHRPSSDVLQ